MKGYVDDHSRPILKIEIGAKAASIGHEIEAWIDTAFDGHFVLPIGQIETLGLEALAETEAILADGNKIVLQTYVCYLRWFGKIVPAQVVANDGRFPLFGTAFLSDRVLTIDFAEKSVTIE